MVGWVVGCLVVGIGLVATYSAIGGEAWTDERILLVRLGFMVIGLGLIGILSELVLVLASLRRSGTHPTSPTETASASTEGLEQARVRLAELEAKEANEQRRMFGSAMADRAQYVRGMRTDYEKPSDSLHGRQGPPEAWARVTAWADETSRLLRRDLPDEPSYAIEFDKPIDPMATADADWRVNIATFIETKATRLESIARELQGMP